MKAKAAIGVSGRYKLTVRKADGSVARETPWCKNVLTLNYFNSVFGDGGTPLIARGCVVGTGNATPAETDTTLQAYLASTTTVQTNPAFTNNWTVSPRYARATITFRFAQGSAAGNVSEVGIVAVSSGISASTPVLSRALVVDSEGAPTSVTVFDDEWLDVTWECTWYVPEDVAGSFSMTIDDVPTSFDYVVRAAEMDSISWAPVSGTYLGIGFLQPRTGTTSQGNQNTCSTYSQTTLGGYDGRPGTYSARNNAESYTAAAYVPDSKQRTYTIRFGLNSSNEHSGGIGSIFVGGGGVLSLGAFQISLSPKVLKTSDKIFDFQFTLSMDNA